MTLRLLYKHVNEVDVYIRGLMTLSKEEKKNLMLQLKYEDSIVLPRITTLEKIEVAEDAAGHD